MAKAKQDIEKKLVTSGPNVVRHLSLPLQGRPIEWIDAEMAKMDEECGGGDKWKLGKLSGAVYHGGEDIEVRALAVTHFSSLMLGIANYRERVQALCCQ
jgi:sphinganine-1-phosphate aldolase